MATGSVGRHAVAAVGAIVYSDAKSGRDVGDGCGIGDVALTATTDPDEIVALDADCVLYMPQGEMNPMGALDDICRLLMSGKNVVSTAVTGLIYPRSLGDRVVERLEADCAEGQTSFHATRMPAWFRKETATLRCSGAMTVHTARAGRPSSRTWVAITACPGRVDAMSLAVRPIANSVPRTNSSGPLWMTCHPLHSSAEPVEPEPNRRALSTPLVNPLSADGEPAMKSRIQTSGVSRTRVSSAYAS